MERRLFTCLAVAGCLAVSLPAIAQRDAGAKARGDYFFYGHSSHSHLHGAAHHASHYSNYLKSAPTVSPQVSGMAHTSIDHHINQTQAHLDALKKGLMVDDNKDALTQAAAVDGHLDQARQHHDALKRLSDQKPVDVIASQQAVAKLQAALDHAMTDLETLLHSLNLGTPAARKATPRP